MDANPGSSGSGTPAKSVNPKATIAKIAGSPPKKGPGPARKAAAGPPKKGTGPSGKLPVPSGKLKAKPKVSGGTPTRVDDRTLKPQKTLFGRKLHWEALHEGNIEGTIFEELTGAPDDDDAAAAMLDPDHVRSLFASQKKAAQSASSAKRDVGDAKDAIFSGARAQNLAIALARFPMPLVKFADALNQLQFDDLDTDILNAANSVVPKEEELSALRKYVETKEGDLGKLRAIERGFVPLLEVPELYVRLRIAEISLQFELTVRSIEEDLDLLYAAGKEFRVSRKLKSFLMAVLLWGNFVNHGLPEDEAPQLDGGLTEDGILTRLSSSSLPSEPSQKKSQEFQRTSRRKSTTALVIKTYGFTMKSLLKLADFRTALDPSISSLHYIVANMSRAQADLEVDLLPEDFPSLASASRVDLKSLEEELAILQSKLAFLKAQAGKKDIYGERSSWLESQQEKCEEVLDNLKLHHRFVVNFCGETAAYFGEASAKTNPGAFIGFYKNFWQFLQVFRSCVKDIKEHTKKFNDVLIASAKNRGLLYMDKDESGIATNPNSKAKSTQCDLARLQRVENNNLAQATRAKSLSTKTLALASGSRLKATSSASPQPSPASSPESAAPSDVEADAEAGSGRGTSGDERSYSREPSVAKAEFRRRMQRRATESQGRTPFKKVASTRSSAAANSGATPVAVTDAKVAANKQTSDPAKRHLAGSQSRPALPSFVRAAPRRTTVAAIKVGKLTAEKATSELPSTERSADVVSPSPTGDKQKKPKERQSRLLEKVSFKITDDEEGPSLLERHRSFSLMLPKRPPSPAANSATPATSAASVTSASVKQEMLNQSASTEDLLSILARSHISSDRFGLKDSVSDTEAQIRPHRRYMLNGEGLPVTDSEPDVTDTAREKNQQQLWESRDTPLTLSRGRRVSLRGELADGVEKQGFEEGKKQKRSLGRTPVTKAILRTIGCMPTSVLKAEDEDTFDEFVRALSNKLSRTERGAADSATENDDATTRERALDQAIVMFLLKRTQS